MFNNMNSMATHQGTTLTWAARHSTFPPTTGTRITWETNLASSIALLSTNKFNATLQGGTATNVATTTTTWNDSLTVTFTAAFANDLAARAFFNAGGQLGINSSHPAGGGTTINTLISDLCSDAGTVWLSAPSSGTVSLAGTSYSGVTKVGGANPAGATISTNSGFYAQTSTSTQIFKQFSDTVFGSYGTGTFMNISASYDGTGTLTLVVVYDQVPDGVTVSTGTVTTLTVKSPSTAALTNSWGTPALSNVISAVEAGINAQYLAVAGGGGSGGFKHDSYTGGGGGAGGLLAGTRAFSSGSSIAIVVGAGGVGSALTTSVPTNGGNTTMTGALTLTVTGGGFGGYGNNVFSKNPPIRKVGNGGSGGGSGGTHADNLGDSVAYVTPGGLGIPGTGNNGGSAFGLIPSPVRGGGGGGAGGPGAAGNSGTSGLGGLGLALSITGAAVTYAVGGSAYLASRQTGWTGLAGKGDGGEYNTTTGGSNGGSGVVIIAYPGTVAKATGGSISTVSWPGWVVHTFTTSGTFTVL
jgi:hypothetical protein